MKPNKPWQFELDQYTGPIQPPAPLFAGAMTGATYYMRAGPRVATLAGAIGMGAVGGTFALYSILGIPSASKGWLWFWRDLRWTTKSTIYEDKGEFRFGRGVKLGDSINIRYYSELT